MREQLHYGTNEADHLLGRLLALRESLAGNSDVWRAVAVALDLDGHAEDDYWTRAMHEHVVELGRALSGLLMRDGQ